jgi:hypothetical protein
MLAAATVIEMRTAFFKTCARWPPLSLSAAGGIRTHTSFRTMRFERIESAVPPPPPAVLSLLTGQRSRPRTDPIVPPERQLTTRGW